MSHISHLKPACRTGRSILPIHGSDERSVSFRLSGFQFPPSVFGPDDDWIEMEFNIKEARKEWHVTDPSLTAEEVRQLADWLCAVAENNFAVKELHFLEPNLSFSLSYNYGKTKIIKIAFNAELRPAWFREKGEYAIDAHVGNRQLKLLAESLHEQLKELYIKSEVIASEAKQPPIPDQRIASSLRFSQ